MTDLSCTFLHLSLKNPTVLASGILGTSPTLLQRVALAGAGAVTSKSCGPEPRTGHPNPVCLDWGAGLINAIGLTNPGVEEETLHLAASAELLRPLGVPLIASIFAPSVEAFAEVARKVSAAQPDLIEVNISCPNVGDEFGTPFAGLPETAAAVTAAVKSATSIPICVKLAPNVPVISRIAKAVVEAGADAITAVNTMPGMVIDANAGTAVLSNKFGGISGSALKPIALRCVAEIARAVQVPIIGTGGVITGRDAAEMIMAGATVVGIGSAAWYRGPEVFTDIVNELAIFMQAAGYSSIEEMRGVALQ